MSTRARQFANQVSNLITISSGGSGGGPNTNFGGRGGGGGAERYESNPFTPGPAGSGGSGIVIIRYLI